MSLPDNKLVIAALKLAEKVHKGQKRMYTEEAYVNHPIRVAELLWNILRNIEDSNLSDKIIYRLVAAALLHDTVEDTSIKLEEFEVLEEEAEAVLSLVLWLTNDKSLKGKRKWRKFAMFERLKNAPIEAKLIKLVDRYDNVEDFKLYNPDFLNNIYAGETEKLIDACGHCNKLFGHETTCFYIMLEFKAIIEKLLEK